MQSLHVSKLVSAGRSTVNALSDDDAAYVKARDAGRIVSAAVIEGGRPQHGRAARGAGRGRRPLGGRDILDRVASRRLRRRGLRGVTLVVSDAHDGVKAAVAKLTSVAWRRCRVHAQRNALAHAGESGRRVVSAFIAPAFAQDSPEAAKVQWRKVSDRLRRSPKPSSPRRGGTFALA
jgi:transposase-like protein